MRRRGRTRSGSSRASSPGGVRHPVGVSWERLEVERVDGIDALDLRFPAGLATLIRPNEWGKSTVVRTLLAVLFGPSPSDPTAGRSEEGAGAPTERPGARLTFVGVDGARYLLERDLASGDGRLRKHRGEVTTDPDDADWEPVEVDERGDLAGAVEDAIGLGSREAFEQSFCVSQPLRRADRLSAEVQRLLVGSGRGGVELALASLEEEVARRTRDASRWGLEGGAEDGALEGYDARIAALERSLREGREATDGAQDAARSLAEAEARREQHREEAVRLERDAERLRAYLAGRRAFEQRLEAERAAAQTLARAEALQGDATRAHARVGEVWPELAKAPDDGEARLAALLATERVVAEASGALEVAERAHELARRTASERSRELERHTTRAPVEEDNEGLTVDAVRELRAGAEQAVADWRAFLHREEGVAEARTALRPYAMLALAPEQDRALLRRYDYEAEARVRAAEGLEVAVREARAERRRLLVPDPSLPNDLEAEALRAALEAPDRRARALAVQGAAGLLLGAAVFWVGREATGIGVAAGLGVLVALGIATLLRPPAISGPRVRRFRGRSRAEIEELLSRYDAWRAQPVPTRRDVARLEHEMEAAREQLRAFQRRMQPYQEAFPEPGSAFDAFREAQRTLLQREEVHRELAIRTFGVAPAEVKGRSPLDMPSPWPRLAAFAGARGGHAHSVGELCGFLVGVEAGAWDEVLGAAVARDEARRAFRTERERLRREVAVADTVLEEREATATALRAELGAAEQARDAEAEPLAELLEPSGGDAHELLRRWRERDQALQEAERSFDALASLLDASDCESLDALRDRVERRRQETLQEQEAVDALAGSEPELPSADREIDRSRFLDRLEALEERLTFEREARQAAEAEVYERTRALAALQAKPVINLAKAESERTALLEQRARVTAELDALAITHVELRAAVRDFQGSYRERLESLASGHFATLTGREGRSVRLLDDFGVTVREPDGAERTPEQLSQGAQDQLALALRLAVADHVADDVRLPLVLDDPFLHWDAVRLEVLRAGLERLARERQVVLLSHNQVFGAWGEAVTVA